MEQTSIYRCDYCGIIKGKGQDYWQVKIINSDGRLLNVPACCKECAEKNQVFQKIKI